MFIKAIYADGWKWNNKGKKIRRLDDFILAVVKEDGVLGTFDSKDPEEIEACIKAVFKVLRWYVSEGEILDIIALLPPELKPLFSS